MNADLYKIIEDNFRLNNSDKMKLLGAFQKLEQYENNPLAQMEPCWKFVKINGIKEQLDHISREINEVMTAQGLENLALECFDVLQSALSLMHILDKKFNVDLQNLVRTGTSKNSLRGYYVEGDEP